MTPSDCFPIKIIQSRSTRLKAYLSGKVSNPHDVEDLCQEVFFVAIKNINRLKDRNKIDPWLFGICRNILKRYYSDKKRKVSSELPEIPVDDRANEKMEIALLVNELPDRLRVVFELHYVQCQKILDISRILEMSEGTVKYHLFELRRRVKNEIIDKKRKEEAI